MYLRDGTFSFAKFILYQESFFVNIDFFITTFARIIKRAWVTFQFLLDQEFYQDGVKIGKCMYVFTLYFDFY